MKMKSTSRVIAVLLAVLMLVTCVSTSAFATIANWAETNVTYSGSTFGTNGYYNVISKKDYTLVPGAATETEMVLNNAAGTRRQVMHIIEVDPSNPDVSVLPGYYYIDKDLSDVNYQKAAGVTAVAQYYDTELGYNVVGAMNTDLDYTDNAPRVLVYNGQNLTGFSKAGAPKSVLYVWNIDGEISCEVTSYNKATMEAGVANGTLLHAISVSFAMVVSDGELVSPTEERTSESAARSLVGVKEDGTLVLVMNDGRNANNSKGFCNYEEGEAMLALGCKWAANCDGGGSSSFVTRRAGEDDLVCRCVPCDGAERPTKSSVIVVSNVAPTGVLDNIDITADYDYFAPGTTYSFGAKVVDTHGYAMDMPADASWSLSDASFGTIRNGVFTSSGKLGDVDVLITSNGAVVGSRTIYIANPETLSFAQSSTVLPYGKSTTLEFVSKIGEFDVFLDGSSFTYNLSNPNAGSLDGLVFTATTDESIANVIVTATYVPTGAAYRYSIEFGKGSEILWDFEDGDLHGFMGHQDAYDWQLANGVETPFGYSGDGLNTLIGRGQISPTVASKAFIATKENGGQVHNGDKALGFEFDMTQVSYNDWVYCVMFNISNVNGDVVLRDVANGKKATHFGCWVYVPKGFYTAENSGALALQANLFGGATKESAAQIGLNMQYNGKNLNSLKESDIPENRWVYCVANISGYNYVSLVDPLQMNYRSPSIMRMYVKPSVSQKLTYYFDNFTLDYSSAVDDRVPPVISNPTYAPNDTNIAFSDGVVLTESSAAFNATVADANSGIDASTAAIYVDGNKVTTTKVTGSMIHCDAVALGWGTHKVMFEIADKLGNYSTLTRTIVSETTDKQLVHRNRVELNGHNDSGAAPMPDSIYYIDVCNPYSQGLKDDQFTLYLNTANTWILDQMQVADGYTVDYVVNESEPNKVTFTCSSDHKNNTGTNEVMFTIPVRLYNPVLTVLSDGAQKQVSGKSFIAALSVEVIDCTIAGTYGNYFKYEVADIAGVRPITRHEHTAYALADVDATCTEAGYTGRTYCDVCASVVDWGTTVPATGHNYVIADGAITCTECGDTLTGTGVVEANGKLYYIINGTVATGWQDTGDGYCYADPETFELYVDGEYEINGLTYTFDANGVVIKGAWIVSANGARYSYGPKTYLREWGTIDGKDYYFGRDGYKYTGIRFIKYNPATTPVWYDFGEDGAADKNTPLAVDGLYEFNGDLYYVVGGETQFGLQYVDGSYYFFEAGSGFERVGYAAKNKTITVTSSNSNGLPLTTGVYDFGDDGRMLIYDGPVNGYFYESGAMLHAYTLVRYDGDYYFISDYNRYVTNQTVYLFADWLEGTRMSAGYYDFDENGKMIIRGGAWDDGFFYVNGVKQKAYQVIKYNDEYYFISDYNKYAVNKTVYLFADWLEGTNLSAGYYDFDEYGRMVIRNGAYPDGYFYLGNVKQKAYQVIEFEGDYYYIGDGNRYCANKRAYLFADWLEGTNLRAGYYEFDEFGRMILD